MRWLNSERIRLKNPPVKLFTIFLSVAVIVAVNEGKASIAAAVTDDLTGKVSAVDLVRAGVEALGGKGGGGRADMAQGGGPDGDKATDAIAAAKAVLAG